MADVLNGMNPVDRDWIVSLAEGFRLAGATHSPIVPNPQTIQECIETAITVRHDSWSKELIQAREARDAADARAHRIEDWARTISKEIPEDIRRV